MDYFCLVFILEALSGLKTKQGDMTEAFLHADLDDGKVVSVEMPYIKFCALAITRKVRAFRRKFKKFGAAAEIKTCLNFLINSVDDQ